MSSQSTPAGAQPTTVSNAAQSHPYTCNTCQVAFRSNELQRGHMRSDWHRYNLKRRVASLPPLSSEVFAEKVINAQASTNAAAAKASFEKPCIVCHKTYYSENAYQNHLGSQKHHLNVAALQSGNAPVIPAGADDETNSVMSSAFSLGEPVNLTPAAPSEPVDPSPETVDPEAEAEFSKVIDGIKEATINENEPVSRRPTRPHHSAEEKRSEHPLSPSDKGDGVPSIAEVAAPTLNAPLSQCLFCNYESPSFKLNLHHMTKFHGMFIPEQPYLADLEGLIGYLHRKIAENHECLYCHKLKSSTSGIQTHMRDKGHCMIAFETEEEMVEVGQFYDFTSTYSDHGEDEEMLDGDGGVKLGRLKAAKTFISNEDGDQEMDNTSEGGEGWETDDDDAEPDPEAEPTKPPPITRRPSQPRRPSLLSTRRHSAIDDYHPNPRSPSRQAFTSDYELHLPSGRTAGHRSLARYFRQNLHSYPTPTERAERRAIQDGTADSDEEMAPDQPNERGRQLTTRANGGLGMVGVTDAKKREVKAVEQRETRRAQRELGKFQWGVEKRANQQKHFRDPLLQ